MLSAEQLRRFAGDGYLVVPGAVPEELLDRADAEVDVVAEDPPPRATVGPHFSFRPPARLPPCHAALRSSAQRCS